MITEVHHSCSYAAYIRVIRWVKENEDFNHCNVFGEFPLKYCQISTLTPFDDFYQIGFGDRDGYFSVLANLAT